MRPEALWIAIATFSVLAAIFDGRATAEDNVVAATSFAVIDAEIPADGGWTPDQDVQLALRIHLLRGHLAAAKVLASQNRYEEALPHANLLRSDLVRTVESELLRRGAPRLQEQLALIAEDIKSHTEFTALLAGIRQAEIATWASYSSIDATRRSSLDFNLELSVLLLKQSAREYQAAWRGLRLANLQEFQAGYGFLLETHWLLARALPQVRKRDVRVATNIENAYIRLQLAWPSVDPPAKPVLPYSTINGLVAAIEINANRLH